MVEEERSENCSSSFSGIDNGDCYGQQTKWGRGGGVADGSGERGYGTSLSYSHF